MRLISLLSIFFWILPSVSTEGGSSENKVKILRKLLGDNSRKNENHYKNQARKFDEDSLRKLSVAVDSVGDIHDALQASRLIKLGLPPKQLAIINPGDFENMYVGYFLDRWPRKFIKQNAFPEDLFKYSINAAESTKGLVKNPEWLRKTLKSKISLRNHLFRDKATYREDVGGLDTIQSIYTLSLLLQYVDFFEGPQAAKEIPKLFSQSYGNNFEEGGMLFSKKGNLEFLPFYNCAQEEGKIPWEMYITPLIQSYVPNLGDLHTHPMGADDPTDKFAGPSETGDLRIMRALLRVNPLFINVVVTEMKQDRYNVDVYMSSNLIVGTTKTISSLKLVVIDLGVYHWKK